jgi:hypothetical protein
MAAAASSPINAEQLAEVKSQIKDLKPLVERKDRVLTRWELEFLERLIPIVAAGTEQITFLQYSKTNQIYETKYLRGIYGGKRKFS